jgi:hypothetical protein
MTTTPTRVTTNDRKGEIAVDHIDFQNDDPKADVALEGRDRFGGYAKSDPKEIALVKKLDLYLMVSLEAPEDQYGHV